MKLRKIKQETAETATTVTEMKPRLMSQNSQQQCYKHGEEKIHQEKVLTKKGWKIQEQIILNKKQN